MAAAASVDYENVITIRGYMDKLGIKVGRRLPPEIEWLPTCFLTPEEFEFIERSYPIKETKKQAIATLNKAWTRAIIDYVQSILEQFISNTDLIEKLVGKSQIAPDVSKDSVRQVWYNAFTDSTYDINNNYETLEKYGDTVLEYCFALYLWKADRTLDQDDINNLQREYMSKKKQAEYSKALCMPLFIRKNTTRVGLSLAEDVFEAFFGALVTVGDMVQEGYGTMICKGFVTAFMNDNPIDQNATGTDAKTRITQGLDRLCFNRVSKGEPIYKEFSTTSAEGNQFLVAVEKQNLIEINKNIAPYVKGPIDSLEHKDEVTGKVYSIIASERGPPAVALASLERACYDRLARKWDTIGLHLHVVNQIKGDYDMTTSISKELLDAVRRKIVLTGKFPDQSFYLYYKDNSSKSNGSKDKIYSLLAYKIGTQKRPVKIYQIREEIAKGKKEIINDLAREYLKDDE